jgi:methylglutaconyl-CoA hydratase
MTSNYQTIALDHEGEVATITLNRPEKRNAISSQMIAEMLAAFDAVENSKARVAIITGSGRAFCAGMDLDALRSLAGQSLEQTSRTRAASRAFCTAFILFRNRSSRR